MSNKMTLQFKLNNEFINPLVPSAKDSFVFGKVFSLINGVGAGKAETIWHDERQLAASANEELDMSGVLTGSFGVVKAFTKIKMIMVYASPDNTNNVLVGGAASNGLVFGSLAADKLIIKPGSMFTLLDNSSAGIPVVAGTGDLLKIENSSSGSVVDYTIAIVGEIT